MNSLTRFCDAAVSGVPVNRTVVRAGLCLAMLFARLAGAQEAPSGVAMKMTEHLNQVIEQGVVTLNSLQQNKPAPSAPAARPVVAKLKMDKINARFVEQQDEIVDRVFHLTWSRCSLGQHWVSAQGCVGKVRQYSYDQALSRSNEQWRLPTRAELATLIDRTKKNQPELLAIDSVAFPDMDRDKLLYWSSDEENNSFAWAVLFIDGGIPGILYRSHRYAVRLVKNAA